MASEWFTSTTGNCDVRVITSNRHGIVIDYLANTQMGSIVGEEAARVAQKIESGKTLSGRYFEGHKFIPTDPMWE
jgi:hypothetical protein